MGSFHAPLRVVVLEEDALVVTIVTHELALVLGVTGPVSLERTLK